MSAAGPTPAAPAAERNRIASAVTWVELRWAWFLAALVLAAGLLLLYMGRGLTFFYDDWDFVLHDYGGGLHSLLVAHNGNISLFPVATYKVLFHVVGLDHYAVFRSMAILLHLVCGVLVYVLAARRIPRAPALLAASLILFLGAAWEDILWAFQIGYLLSVAAGLGAWVALDRPGRRSDLLVMVCLIVSIGSSSLGIPVVVGVAAELAFSRRWRAWWVITGPVVLYAIWYLGYGESQVTLDNLIKTPGYAAEIGAAAFGGLVGRSLEWGRPLAVVGVIFVLRRLMRPGPAPPRLTGLLVTGAALWTVTAAARANLGQPESSRYVYLGAVVIVLAGVELLHEVPITPRATAVAALAVAYCVLAGMTILHVGAQGLRSTSTAVAAELAAMEIASARIPPTYQPDPQRAPQITAGPYLHTVRSIGSSPADSPEQIIESGSSVRTLVDERLITLEGVTLLPVAANAATSSRPLLANVSGSAPVAATPACWRTTSTGQGAYTEFAVPSGGLVIHAGKQPVQVVARRFSAPLGGVVVGAVPAAGEDRITFPADSSGRPWFVRVSSEAPTGVCGAG